LPPDRKDALRDAQRAWIAFRDRTCGFEAATRGEAPTPEDAMQRCVRRLTLARVEDLKAYASASAMASATESAAPSVTNGCRMAALPAKFTVQALGVYKGHAITDVKLDDSWHEVRTLDVVANKPGEDVVLVLMAYDPVLWKVAHTPRTRIAAVIVGGYHGQQVEGIAKAVPLSISTHTGRKDCSEAFQANKASPELLRASEIVRAMTGRGIDHFTGDEPRDPIVVGDPLPDGADVVRSDERDRSVAALPRLPAGREGLAELVAQGALRRATDADIAAWVAKASEKYKSLNKNLEVRPPSAPNGVYTVLRTTSFPSGLFGGNMAAFLIPVGVPVPSGNPGHSVLYFIEDGSSCLGPMCGVR